MKMKAITLWQPWASLVVLGEKKIETRSYFTSVRGRIAIHAAKLTDRNMQICRESFDRPDIIKALLKHGITEFSQLPLGALVGTVDLFNCLQMTMMNPGPHQIDMRKITDAERAMGHYEMSRYAWMLKNPVVLINPVPYRGSQGFFDIDKSIIGE